MKITRDVEEMLRTEPGCLKLIALKLCEISETLKSKPTPKKDTRSLFEMIFGSTHCCNCED